MTIKHLFKFGEFTLWVDERKLFQSGKDIALTPKMYELLLVFLRHPGRVLEKDFLLNAVWPDSFVEEGNISFNIRQLRKALGDDAQTPIYIETIPRRGYRFVAQVDELATDDESAERIAGSADKRTPAVRSRRLVVVALSAGVALLAMGVAAAWFLTGGTVRATPILNAPFSLEKLSTDGQVVLVEISKDGKSVVYSRRNAGKQSLWVMQLGTSDNTQIVPPSEFIYYGLALSPDGKAIYFSRGKDANQLQCDIYREPISGGVPQRVISEAQGWISLSADGAKISFVRCPYEADENCSLWVANSLDGANEKKLVSRPKPIRIGDNKISPDGKTIAFAFGQSSTYSNDFELAEVNIDTGTERALTPEKFFNVEHLTWLPDQTGLLVTARRHPDKSFRVWHISQPSGDATALTDDSQNYNALSLNSDGSSLVTSQVAPEFRLNIYQSNEPLSRPKPLGNAMMVNFASDSEVVFASGRTGNNEIWSINTDGSGERQLTNTPSDEASPLVSEGDNSIFFVSNRTGKIQIWKMNHDGSNQTQVTFSEGGLPLITSSDGNWLYYKTAIEKVIKRISLRDGHEELVFKRPSVNSSISPEGDRVALTEKINEQNSLNIVSLPDGNVIKTYKLVQPKENVICIVWSSDGRYLAYVLFDDTAEHTSIWMQPIEANAAREITELSEQEVFESSGLAISPDGKTLAAVQGTWHHDAVIIRGLR